MRKKRLRGEVISVKNQKTISVLVKSNVYHPLYKRNYIRFKKYHVHDEKNLAKQGDLVEFEQTRPISKTKRWRLIKILEKHDSKKNNVENSR